MKGVLGFMEDPFLISSFTSWNKGEHLGNIGGTDGEHKGNKINVDKLQKTLDKQIRMCYNGDAGRKCPRPVTPR